MNRPAHLSNGRRASYSTVYRQEVANLESVGSGPLLCDDTDIFFSSHVDVDSFETHARNRSRSLSSPSELEDVDDGDVLTAGGLDLKALQDKTREEASSDIEGLRLTNHVSLSTNVEVRIPVSTLTQPRSLFEGAEPPAPQTTEAKAVAVLLDALKSRGPIEGEDFLEFELDDFSIYIDAPQYPNELRPLQHLNKADRFFFDGILSVGDTRLYLRRVPFRELPVGNYGDEHHSVGDQIWIRSILNERLKKEIYYRLMSPSVEYARYYAPFLWIADLAKHVIDYCEHLRTTDRRVVLYDFKSRFSIWILRKHRNSEVFRKWYEAHGDDDFRGAIVANIKYIWREAYGLDPQSATYHHFWKETGSLDRYLPNLAFADKSSDREGRDGTSSRRATQTQRVPKTTVTPYIHDLFRHMSFGKVLESVELSTEVKNCQEAVIKHSTLRSTLSQMDDGKRRGSGGKALVKSIKCGDVVSTSPDDAKRTTTRWKVETSAHHDDQYVWYGLVQQIHQTARGERAFDVIWMYHPRDTPCAKMKYPWKNELFLSDNCTCHSDVAKVREEDIISAHTVDWFGTPTTSRNLFVRQTYLCDEQRWITLQHEHMECESRGLSRQSEEFEVGDAVLVQTQPTSLDLENFVIEAFFVEGTTKFVRLRRLLRRRLVDPGAPKSPLNELVYSERLVEMEAKSIARRCLVRAFHTDERIPAPYDRNGTGDAFFITHQELATGDGKTRFVPVDPDALSPFRQGFNPNCTAKSERLRGLDLFCGGGNFGRGLEDGGAIEMRWANDIWGEAIHTYMANTTPGTCTPFLGSVDDLLRQALLGGKKAPRPGEVDFISGGSPCPGFSLLTHDKTTDKQRKNQSLVASFASYVDLYRPHYGLLENVIQMVQSKHNRDECVFSQLVSAIVGLGYQTQILLLDAWSFGAPQSRSRVFLMFTAPGLRVPKAPIPTHSRPDVSRRKLGLMSNGQSFSQREHLPTPFKFVSAMEATGDLPDIQDSKADYCVGFPDHRLAMGYTPTLRKQVQHIPTQPWGMNFSKAYYGGFMDESTRKLYPTQGTARVSEISRGWGRIEPNSVFPTITTTCCPTDARVGQLNHWYQPRPITILEARRAQGFLDNEVIVGSALNQYRIVGNSVARQVALALGLAVREAWFGTMRDEKPIPQEAADNKYVITKSIETGLGAPSDPILLDSSSDEQSAGVTEPLPQETPLTTPAISDMSERTGSETRRKRTSTFYVEVVAKRHRPTVVRLDGDSGV
ncbi:hypothetical protein DL765_001991 [Monosporascus sp. GIB2]|nr:hypothetical protein DL765_001991 [Monosporascus sp. GIB2]